MSDPDPFGARTSLGAGLPDYYRLAVLAERLELERTPVTLSAVRTRTLSAQR